MLLCCNVGASEAYTNDQRVFFGFIFLHFLLSLTTKGGAMCWCTCRLFVDFDSAGALLTYMSYAVLSFLSQ